MLTTVNALVGAMIGVFFIALGIDIYGCVKPEKTINSTPVSDQPEYV